MTAAVSCPEHVRSVDVGGATVVVDVRRGRVETLLGRNHRTWVALARTGDTATAAASAGDSSEIAALVDRWERCGLLRRSDGPRPWVVPRVEPTVASWGTDEAPAAAPLPVPAPRARMLLAGLAVLGVVAVRQCGPRARSLSRLLALVAGANRVTRRRADRTSAVDAVLGVRSAAALLPFRIACLEESVSAVLLLAMTGRGVEWHHGVATDPIRLHAWIALDGCPVAEPPSTARYTTSTRIPSTP